MATPISEILNGSEQNIIDVFERASEIQMLSGGNWYADANQLAQELGQEYGLEPVYVAYAIAALSPSTAWITNKIAIQELLENGSTRYQTGLNNWKANQCLNGNLGALKGNKVRAFAGAIVAPDSAGTAVIDRHAVAVFLNRKMTDRELKVLNRKGAYELVAEAYANAAKTLNMPVHHLQAITWVVWRAEQGLTD